MQPTHRPPSARVVPARQPAQLLGRHSDERGLITLEWLLIVGAIAGLAASSVLIVQRVVDDTSEVPVDPLVRLLEADVAAAFVAAEAQAAFDESLLSGSQPPPPPYVDGGFLTRCESGVKDAFSDVVDLAEWFSPTGVDGTPGTDDDEPARCLVDPLPNLGGN